MLQPSSPLEELVQRVRGEYREMQSLRLTSSQAQRFAVLLQEFQGGLEQVVLARDGAGERRGRVTHRQARW